MTELIVRENSAEAAVRGFSLAESFTPEMRESIAQFVSVDGDHPAFLPFLAIAASYGLDPLMGEVWLIPVTNRVQDPNTGRWGAGPKKYRPAVGRDGLLKIARNSPDFLGLKHDVVHAGDTFIVEHDTASVDAPPKVTHRTAPTFAERGAIVGAWAICYLKGRAPIYYFAPVTEHGRTKDKNGTMVWDGAWSHTSAMMIKAAVSYVLRIGLGVTGVVPVDEIGQDEPEASLDGDPMAALSAAPVESPRDATLRVCSHLDRLLAENVAVRVEQLGWTAARVEMMLAGCEEEEARSFASAAFRPVVEGDVVDEEDDVKEDGALDEREDDDDVPRREGDDVDERRELEAALSEFEDAIAGAEQGSPAHAQLLAEQDVLRQQLDALGS